MTPEEVMELSHIGVVFFENFVRTIIALLLFGIYFLAFCIGLYIYCHKNSTAGGAKKAMICVLLGTFVLMLLLLVSGVAPVPGLVKYALVVTLPGGIMEQIVAADAQSHSLVYNTITNWLSNMVILITDTVIVWRAWAMWMDNAKVRWTLLLLMLANIGVSLADSALDSQTVLNNLAVTLDWVSIVLSFSVNMIATCLISFRAWLHHRSIKSISIARKWTKGERILLLLVESGGIYALLQLLSIIASALSVKAPPLGPISFTSTLTIQFYVAAAALNPVAIFILVQTQNTYEKASILGRFQHPANKINHSMVSAILSGPEGNVAFTEQEINITCSA
ncbi:hypothetical protein BDP27DRAFT_1401044 [Rhodocollybia butyracea]|uniref:Uncharacterized protein n=1 Tax=Rhodocollybia butyracea TaxID=206335 RepID=A0A9P5U9K3_9AGAR|nr:hypothetical protein BDP27DRAFT_1401044 [Rhodocollybia butyracea]